MRVGVYARISQTGERSVAVERQLEDCELFAEDRGWDVSERYVDDGVSAFSKRERPEFQRLLADIKAERLDVLLCYHPDRLSRHTRSPEYNALYDLLEHEDDRRVLIVDADGQEYRLWTSGGDDAFSRAIAVAQHESKRKSERIKVAYRKKRRDGLSFTSKLPYGYAKNRDGAVVQDDDRAQVVREIFDRFLMGERISSIARELRRRGSPSPVPGEGWRARDVSTVLTRPRYAGLYGSRKPTGTGWREFGRELERKGLKGGWPTVITVDELQSAWSRLDENAQRIGTRASATGGPWRAATFMSGIAVCGSCGEPVAAQSSTNPRMMYTCGHKSANRHVQRRIGEVDDFVEQRLVARLGDPVILDAIREVHNERQDQERVHWRQELLQARRIRNENSDDYVNQLVSREEYLRVSETVNERINALEARLDHPAPAAPGDGALALLGSARDPVTAWEGLNLDQRRIVAQAFMDSVWLWADRPFERGVTLTDENVTLVWKGEEPPPARLYPQVASRPSLRTTEQALLQDRRTPGVSREDLVKHATG